MKKKKKIFTKKHIIMMAIVMTAAVAITAIFYVRSTLAVFKESRAMRFSQYKANHTIDDSTLFIGTYLINMAGMSDPIYERAIDSASDSGQDKMYYKSELAGGAWFDVSDAEKLTDISNAGQKISDAELDDLFVQYFVDKDGSVTDVLTGDKINPFNVPDPYNLSRLPELDPIWTQYAGDSEADSISIDDYLKARNSEKAGTLRVDVYKYQVLTTFFNLDLRDDDTDKLDQDLARLFASYQSLKAAGNDEEADLTYKLMGKVDSARRAIVFNKLSQGENSGLGILMSLSGGGNYTNLGNFLDSTSEGKETDEVLQDWQKELLDAVSHDFSKDSSNSSAWYSKLPKTEEKEDDDDDKDKDPGTPFASDSSLSDAVGTSLESCSTSYSTHTSNALSDSDSILGHADYEYSTQVIDEATADGLGGPINYLRDVTNIEENKVKNKDSELDLIDSSFLPLADSKFEGEVSKGASAEYRSTLDADGATAADAVLGEQEGKMEASRTELEFLIDGYRQRTAPADALDYVNNAITRTEGLYGTVKNDEYSSRANGTLDKHMKWLKDEKQKIIDSDSSLKSKLDELNDRKAEAQRKRDAALDDNDLAGARDLDAQIAAIDKDIDAEKGKGAGGDSLNDSLAANAMAKMADDPNADISGTLDALADLGDKDALDKLAQRADDAGASAAQKAAINDAAKKAAGDGKGDGDADGKGTNKNADQLLAILADFFGGKGPNDMDMDELAISTAALSRFSKEGCKAATQLAGQFTEIGRSKNNKYFYNQLNGRDSAEYISLKTINDCTTYRYFYDDTKKTATMTSRSKIYTFVTGSDKMNTGDDDQALSYKVEFSGVPYLSQKDSKSVFGCDDEYVVENTMAVCLTSAMQPRVDELLKKFEE